jgi:bacterioferritin-associated ferredoxin
MGVALLVVELNRKNKEDSAKKEKEIAEKEQIKDLHERHLQTEKVGGRYCGWWPPLACSRTDPPPAVPCSMPTHKLDCSTHAHARVPGNAHPAPAVRAAASFTVSDRHIMLLILKPPSSHLTEQELRTLSKCLHQSVSQPSTLQMCRSCGSSCARCPRHSTIVVQHAKASCLSPVTCRSCGSSCARCRSSCTGWTSGCSSWKTRWGGAAAGCPAGAPLRNSWLEVAAAKCAC